MSAALLETLSDAEKRLRGTMEGGDPETIMEALTAFAAALDAVRGTGAWRADEGLRQRIADLKTRIESDHLLSKLLGDLTRQRLDLLAGNTIGATARVTYSRRG